MAAGAAWWLGRDARSVAQAPAMREYATPRGRRAVLRLLDGTEITLNADSKLRAPVTFAARQRDVYLEGEAYFSVVHDAARPFVVHTGSGAIRDIGTRFGVHAYGDAERERVAVVEGAVALAGTPLRAGQVATLSRTGTIRVLRNARVTDEVAWTRGRLVFANARGLWSAAIAIAGTLAGGGIRVAQAQDPAQGMELAASGPRFLAAASPRSSDGGAAPHWTDASNAAVFRKLISLELNDVSLAEALSAITERAGLRLTYSAAVVPLDTRVTFSASNLTVGAVLSAVLY